MGYAAWRAAMPDCCTMEREMACLEPWDFERAGLGRAMESCSCMPRLALADMVVVVEDVEGVVAMLDHSDTAVEHTHSAEQMAAAAFAEVQRPRTRIPQS